MAVSANGGTSHILASTASVTLQPPSFVATLASKPTSSPIPLSNVSAPSTSASATTILSTTSASVSSVNSVGWDDLNLPRFYAAGFVAHLSARSVLYPLQVVKTRQQTASAMGEATYSGVGAAMRAIVRNEGARSLWRGFGPNIVMALAGAPYITALEYSKKQYLAHLPKLGPLADNNVRYSVSSFLAGGTASLTTLGFTVPLDIVSQRQQVERNQATRRSAAQILRTVLATDGVRGLWRGMPMVLLTQAPGSSISWGCYETLKRQVYPLVGDSLGSHQWVLSPLCAGMAGSISAVIMTPLDTLRTRQQVQERAHTTLASTWRDLIKQSGYRGLMAGAMPRVLSLGPSAMLMLSMFDALKEFARISPADAIQQVAAIQQE